MEFGKFSLQTHEGGRPGCIKGLNAFERREGEKWSEGEKQRENERAWGLGLAVLLGRPCVSASSISLLSPHLLRLSPSFSDSIFNEINN